MTLKIGFFLLNNPNYDFFLKFWNIARVVINYNYYFELKLEESGQMDEKTLNIDEDGKLEF